MNANKIAIAALGSLLLVGGIAHAAPRDGGPDGKPGPMGPMRADAAFVQMLKLADADKDGKVTKEEADAGFLKLFDAMDANKDGAVTPGEFRTYREARLEEFRKNNPRPADTKDEAKGGPEQAARDEGPDGDRRGPPPPRDGDGPRGFKHHADRDGDRHGPRDHDRRFGRNDGPGRDGKNRPMAAAFLIGKVDTDQNGQVSRDEAKTFGEGIFARLDTNKDGVISIDDLPNRPFP